MEVECAKRLWSRSVAVTNIRYTGMLGDRDSKAFLALQELAPYPGVEIVREECVNHSHNTWVLRWCSWPSSAARWERSWQVDPSQDTETTAILPGCHHIPHWWRWWYERCSVGHPPTLHEHGRVPASYPLPRRSNFLVLLPPYTRTVPPCSPASYRTWQWRSMRSLSPTLLQKPAFVSTRLILPSKKWPNLALQRLHNQERAAQTAEEGVTYAPGGF